MKRTLASWKPRLRSPDVHVDWHMTPAEYAELRAALLGAAHASPYVTRLIAEGRLPR